MTARADGTHHQTPERALAAVQAVQDWCRIVEQRPDPLPERPEPAPEGIKPGEAQASLDPPPNWTSASGSDEA